MGNIVRETDCISSHYSDELEFGEREREEKGRWALFDAMHLIKYEIIRCGCKKKENIANR